MNDSQIKLEGIVDSIKDDIKSLKSQELTSDFGIDCCDIRELTTLHQIHSQLADIDLTISFHEALDIVQSEDDWMEHVSDFTAANIAGTLSQIDLEELARLISNGPDLAAASQLLDELLYWREQGRI